VVAALAVGGFVAHEMAGETQEPVTKQTETAGLPNREESDNVQEGGPAVSEAAGEGAHAVGPQVDPKQPPATLRRTLYDIDEDPRANILDIATGDILKLPDFGSGGEFRRWLEEQGRGEVGFDDPDGGGLGAGRGAKLALLEARAWEAADALSDDDLRKWIAEKGERVVPVKEYAGLPLKEYAAGPKPWPVYVGVRSREGRLAVIRVLGFVEDPAERLPGLELEVKPRKAQIRIETIKPMRMACVRHVGPFEEYGKAWTKLMVWAGPLGLLGPKTVYAGISYDDPSVVEPAKLRSDACISVPKDMIFEQGILVQFRCSKQTGRCRQPASPAPAS